EAAFLFRSLSSLTRPPEWLGQTGLLMIARAQSELGFDDRMVDLYSEMIAQGVTNNVESEILFSLANHDFSHGTPEAAKAKWVKLTVSANARWANRSRLRLAEAALSEGNPQDCLDYCQSIKTSEGIVRTDVQKLMGRACEQMGDDAAAARYYAG